MRTLITLAAFAVALSATSPASAACLMSYCKTPTTRAITNERRQRVGDLYDPGHGRAVQIRNNRRQILGYIQPDGTVTNLRRQEVLSIEMLGVAN
jgi:hypothetical protein